MQHHNFPPTHDKALRYLHAAFKTDCSENVNLELWDQAHISFWASNAFSLHSLFLSFITKVNSIDSREVLHLKFNRKGLDMGIVYSKFKPLIWLTFCSITCVRPFYMTAVMMLLCLWLFFYYSIFSCGNNQKLLLFRHVQGEIISPFHSDCIQLCFQLRYSPYISPKSCILAKVSKLCLRRCMLEFWWKVAVKAGAFQLPINSFTLSVQRRNSRWLCGTHLMSYLVAQSGLKSHQPCISPHLLRLA